jgi:hypothetical protein
MNLLTGGLLVRVELEEPARKYLLINNLQDRPNRSIELPQHKLFPEQYCSRYMVGTRGKGVSTGTNHLGFRAVMGANGETQRLR